MSYDRNSTDAMFSRIEAALEAQDKTLDRIEAAVLKTNGRVTALERFRDLLTAKTAWMAAGVSSAVMVAGWLIALFFGR